MKSFPGIVTDRFSEILDVNWTFQKWAKKVAIFDMSFEVYVKKHDSNDCDLRSMYRETYAELNEARIRAIRHL